MKRKTITLVVYMLVCISLVSVGFAAWVITGGDQTSTSGSITATVVEDRSLTVVENSEKWTDKNDVTLTGEVGKEVAFVFGRPEGNSGSGWIQYSNTDPVESLQLSYQFDLKSDTDLKDAFGSGTITFTQPANLTKYQGDTYKYISAPTFKIKVGNNDEVALPMTKNQDNANQLENSSTLATEFGKLAAGVKQVTVKITITYTWGDHFDYDSTAENQNLNPYKFYSKYSSESDEFTSIKEDAITVLTNIYTDLNGQTYSLLFDLDSKSANANQGS